MASEFETKDEESLFNRLMDVTVEQGKLNAKIKEQERAYAFLQRQLVEATEEVDAKEAEVLMLKMQNATIVNTNRELEKELKLKHIVDAWCDEPPCADSEWKSKAEKYQRLKRALKIQVIGLDNAVCAYNSKLLSMKRNGECVVCCEAIKEEEAGQTLAVCVQCLHVFHGNCLDSWMKQKETCPMCRNPFKRLTVHKQFYPRYLPRYC